MKIEFDINEPVKIKLDEGAFPPIRAHETDAGMDIMTPTALCIRPGDSLAVDTGVHIQLPHGTVGMLKSKSGLNVKWGIQSEGVIDEGYTGSIVAKLYNNGDKTVMFQRGDKITQLVIIPCLYAQIRIVQKLDNTERGTDGFGSTGR